MRRHSLPGDCCSSFKTSIINTKKLESNQKLARNKHQGGILNLEDVEGAEDKDAMVN